MCVLIFFCCDNEIPGTKSLLMKRGLVQFHSQFQRLRSTRSNSFIYCRLCAISRESRKIPRKADVFLGPLQSIHFFFVLFVLVGLSVCLLVSAEAKREYIGSLEARVTGSCELLHMDGDLNWHLQERQQEPSVQPPEHALCINNLGPLKKELTPVSHS